MPGLPARITSGSKPGLSEDDDAQSDSAGPIDGDGIAREVAPTYNGTLDIGTRNGVLQGRSGG